MDYVRIHPPAQKAESSSLVDGLMHVRLFYLRLWIYLYLIFFRIQSDSNFKWSSYLGKILN